MYGSLAATLQQFLWMKNKGCKVMFAYGSWLFELLLAWQNDQVWESIARITISGAWSGGSQVMAHP